MNNKFFEKLNHLNYSLYEVESKKSKVEHKEPIIVGFLILQYAKLRMLELYYQFLHNSCDISSFEQMEMDTDSLYLPLAHKSLEDCIKAKLEGTWNTVRKNDCSKQIFVNSTSNVFPGTCCERHIKHGKREPGFFKEEIRCTEMICLCSKTLCCFDEGTDKLKSLLKV